MNRENYRKAFDEISFSADFQERTIQLLRARKAEKENEIMTFGKTKKAALLIAAAVALLVISVSAAVLWLTPAQVAEGIGLPLLAEAFTSEDAIVINETQETGGLAVTLLGMVTGENLDALERELNAENQNTASGGFGGAAGEEGDKAHTYAVLAISSLDGTPLDDPQYDSGGNLLDENAFEIFDYTMTPLVAGYSPAAVNCWTLGATGHGYPHGGVYYFLLDTESIEMFADHTVYMAFYKGSVPNNTIFTVNDDGTIAFCDDFDDVHALFTLPLDPAKADPAAVEDFIAVYDIGWTNERTPLPEGQDSGESTLVTVGPGGEGENQTMTAGEYEAYMNEELEDLRAWAEEEPDYQQRYEETAREMEKTLEGIRDGSLVAIRQGNGGVFVSTAPQDGSSLQYGETQNGISIVAG